MCKELGFGLEYRSFRGWDRGAGGCRVRLVYEGVCVCLGVILCGCGWMCVLGCKRELGERCLDGQAGARV